MKYIDAEKLKAEIKRRVFEDYNSQVPELDEIAQGALAGLLPFIDSLQQEQPEVDLEKETKSWILNECGPSDFSPFADHWCADDIMATARHFYELGKNSK